MSRTAIGTIALALVASLLGLGGGIAVADGVVITPPPIFVPEAEFHHESGYYRTNDGHYYHYDKDRNGWHYGRNHEEGMRYERKHHNREERREERRD